MFDFFKKKEPPKEPKKQFPPVPDWKPSIVQPLDKIIDRMHYYANSKRDFAVFENGTVAILALGLSDHEAELAANTALRNVFHAHPDMNPRDMDDGNILVGYSHDVVNIVLTDFVVEHWDEINQNHQDALATDEVLFTPLGQNVFDDFGKKALFGRCFMFMDAQNPKVVKIERKTI